jgi:hypothetical protein
VAALLANHLSVLAIAQWGARQRPELLRALGFRDGTTPHQSTLQHLFRRLDPAALSTAVGDYFAQVAPAPPRRGRLAFAATTGGTVHALAAYSHNTGIVLAQQEIRSGAEKAEAELTVAPALLARLDWRGRVLTSDALFCQRALCRQVCEAGGDYLLVVKGNQPALHADLALLFDPPTTVPATPLSDRREATTLERSHGRTQVRLGAGPMVLALLRDTALSLLRATGCRRVTARLRDLAQRPAAVVALLPRTPTQHA